MKNDKLMDSFKEFEVNDKSSITGGNVQIWICGSNTYQGITYYDWTNGTSTYCSMTYSADC